MTTHRPFDLESWKVARQKRRTLRQKLYKIRLAEEDDQPITDPELMSLRDQYEAHPSFSAWSGFPEKWDIGDPDQVRMKQTLANPGSTAMVSRMETLWSHGLDDIVQFGPKQHLDHMPEPTPEPAKSAVADNIFEDQSTPSAITQSDTLTPSDETIPDHETTQADAAGLGDDEPPSPRKTFGFFPKG